MCLHLATLWFDLTCALRFRGILPNADVTFHTAPPRAMRARPLPNNQVNRPAQEKNKGDGDLLVKQNDKKDATSRAEERDSLPKE